MDSAIAFANSLNAGNWIALIFGLVGTIGVSFTAANYLAGRRERKLRATEHVPKVKAIINRKRYEGGWRSVQLHMISGSEDNLTYANWRIERAQLLGPRSVVLARAQDDDYATGVFHPENPVRVLDGKAEGRPQRFALEFFIKFEGEDRGQKVRFKVAFSRVTKSRRHTVTVGAAVPADAE